MQTSVPEVMDISREPKHVLEAYGAQPGAVELRQQLPAGPPAGRAGRAVRPALRLGLGLPRHRARARTSRDGLTKKCAHDGPAGRRPDQGPASSAACSDETLDHLGRRVRPHAVPRRPHRRQQASSAATTIPDCYTMFLAGGGVKGGHQLRRVRRTGLQRRRGQGPRPRPAGHDPAPAGLRPRAAHLPLPGPRLPPDRRRRARGEGYSGLTWSNCRKMAYLEVSATTEISRWTICRRKR